MAASTHHVTVLTPPSSASSSSAPVPTWSLNPLILSSAVILACLISTIVSAATAEDILLPPDASIDGDAPGNITKMNITSSSRNNVGGSEINQNRERPLDLSHAALISSNNNEVENFAKLTVTSSLTFPPFRFRGKYGRVQKILKPKVVSKMNPSVSEGHSNPAMTPYLNMLDDKASQQFLSSFVNFESGAGTKDLKNGLIKSYLESESPLMQGETSRSVGEIMTDTKANENSENVMILDMNGYSDILNLDRDDIKQDDSHKHMGYGPILSRQISSASLNDDPLTNTGYSPLSFKQTSSESLNDDSLTNMGNRPLSSKQTSSGSLPSDMKRYPRSVDNIAEDDVNSLNEDDKMMSVALHNVDKLQSGSEPCSSRNNKIIILKPATFQPGQFFPAFAEEVNKTVQIANTISDLLLYTKSPPEDFIDVFFAMTQSLVETGPQVTGCAIAFSLLNYGPLAASPSSLMSVTPPLSPSPSGTDRTQSPSYEPQSLFPYSYRTKDGVVVVTDLSMLYKPQTTTWFSVHVNRSTEGLLKPKNRIYANKTDMGNLTFYNAKWNRTVSVTPEDGFWATPYYDCLLRNWVIQYSVPFYQLEGTIPEFKGVVLLEANFEAIKINQCAEDGSLFSNTHRCKRATTQCKHIPSAGLQVGSYKCTCKDGYLFPDPSSAKQAFEGRAVENAYMDFILNISSNYTTEFNCLNMKASVPSSTPVSVESIVTFDFLARGIPLGIQSFCMTVAMVIGIVIVCLRKTKVMRSSIWILLEMMLFGAILLYATVVIQYFEPTTSRCLLLPWFREVGFVIVYGVLVLKIYRILAQFQSRKAHRVHVRDKDLFKYLAVILAVVIAYMSAWTAVNIDHLDTNSTILERLYTDDDKLTYTLCRLMWWDYVIESGEFLFLCCGIYMCYCIRSAQTEYSEGRFITGAICYEAVMSSIFYVLRHLWWYKMRPDHLFLMFFIRCQLTVTVVLLIVLGPKLWYAHWPPDDDTARSRAYSQSDVQDSSSPETMKLNVGISSNGDVEVGEISLTEMDPEDIRAELKRLYTQLQIYKTKTMRKDNPHISKRRGGRKRRFSLQAFHHKHRHHHEHDHDHEISKTPEESTNSAEAMTFTIEHSVKEDPNEGRAVPSVSFKSGHK